MLDYNAVVGAAVTGITGAIVAELFARSRPGAGQGSGSGWRFHAIALSLAVVATFVVYLILEGNSAAQSKQLTISVPANGEGDLDPCLTVRGAGMASDDETVVVVYQRGHDRHLYFNGADQADPSSWSVDIQLDPGKNFPTAPSYKVYVITMPAKWVAYLSSSQDFRLPGQRWWSSTSWPPDYTLENQVAVSRSRSGRCK